MCVAVIHIKYSANLCTNNAVFVIAVSLGTVRLVSKTMAQQVPTLSMIIPYLELSTKQEYLVDRIKGLTTVLVCGGCAFIHNTTYWQWFQSFPKEATTLVLFGGILVAHGREGYGSRTYQMTPRFANSLVCTLVSFCLLQL